MRLRGWLIVCALVCVPSLALAQEAPERVPVALSVVGCDEPSPVALMEVLKFEANLRAARAGEVERHVLVVRCETARYVVTLAAPERAPHSRRELEGRALKVVRWDVVRDINKSSIRANTQYDTLHCACVVVATPEIAQ